jgi:RHS repeat-associated protein
MTTATYGGWANGTRQVVLQYDATAVQATGIYDYTVEVKNNYAGSPSLATTLTGSLIVVNRNSSKFGRGWHLAGLEWIQFFGPAPMATQKLLWVGGDGSARIYQPVGDGARWVAPAAAYRDTIHLSGTTFTRKLKHGVQVQYNACGMHTRTIARTTQETTFGYSTGCGTVDHLTTVTVPPSGVGGTYTVAMDGNGKLDKITDPAGRILEATVTSGNLTMLKDPDNVPTSFTYAAGTSGSMTSRINRLGHASDITYTPSGTAYKVASIAVPYGTGATPPKATTGFTPWQGFGLAVGPTGQVAVDTGTSTYAKVLGPRVGVNDDATFLLDAWGAPTRITNALGAVTQIKRQSAMYPALVTEVIYPNNRIVTMRYDTAAAEPTRGRANLRIVRDSTSHLANGLPTKGSAYTYGTSFPDSPLTSKDALNRTTTYTYNATLGLLETETDPRGLVTRFAYETSGSLKGQITTVTAENVETWQEASGTGDDTSVTDVLSNHVTRYGYDAKGNVDSVAVPHGAVTSYANDAVGRTYRSWDPFGMVTELTFDGINRVTQQKQYTAPYAIANPFGLTGPGSLDLTQVIADDSARAFAPALPATVITTLVQGAVGLDLLTGPLSATRGYGYDARTMMREEKDGLLQAETQTYNEAGQVVSTLKRTGHTITREYDVLGRLTAIRIPARSNVHTSNPPETLAVPADSVTYKFDAVTGDLLVAVTAEDSIIRTYFADGSVKSRVYRRIPGDSLADTLKFTYNAAGQRTGMVHGMASTADTVTYTYHATTGDLTSMLVKWGDGVSLPDRTISFTWDKLGRRREVGFSTQPAVSYRYDKLGQLRRLKSVHTLSPSFGNNLDFTYTADVVDARGLLLHAKSRCKGGVSSPGPRPHGACEGATTTTTERWSAYNRFGMLVRNQSDSRIDSLWYDAAGNITKRREPTANRKLHTFGLQASTNRLLTDTDTTGAVRQYAYDANGARVDEVTSGSGLSQNRFYYDALGRTRGTGYWSTVDGSYQFRRDATNCKYDPDGQMLKACDNGAPILVYDGPNVVGIPGAWNTTKATFVSGPGIDDPLIGIVRNGTNSAKELIWVTDGAGRQFAVGGVTGEDPGTLEMDFDGQSGFHGWQWVGGTKRSFGFEAQRQSPRNDGASVAEFSVFRNRLYDPRSGRWTQEDPIGVAGGINLYQYAGSNPLTYSDPFGTCKVDVRFSRVGMGGYHAYIVTTAPDNTRTYFRGGPGSEGPSSGGASSATGGAASGSTSIDSDSGNSSSPGSDDDHGDAGAWGSLTTETGSYEPGTVDYEAGNPTSTNVVDNDEPCDKYNKSFASTLQSIGDKNMPYNPFTTNSNAVVGTALREAGLSMGKRPVWAPSFERNLLK